MPATSSEVGSFTAGSTGIGAAAGAGRVAVGSMAADSRWRRRRAAVRRDSALERRAEEAGSVNSSVVLVPVEPEPAVAGAGPGPAGSVCAPPLAVAAGPAGDGFSSVEAGRTTLTPAVLADLV